MKTCCLLALRSTTGSVSSFLLAGADRGTERLLGIVRFNSVEQMRNALRENVLGEGDERLGALVEVLNSDGRYALGEFLLTDDQINALGFKRPNAD